ncbi:MAG TPA: glutamine synthetase family protein, partial [Geminicoccaceae bacterium]
LPDLNGVLRGKRLGAGALRAALRGECFFTSSLYALDVTGANVERSSIVREDGEADRPAALDPATLRPVPWQPGRAQILGGLAEEDGRPYFADPRALVGRVASRFDELGLTPVAALELEFHVVDGELGEGGRPLVPHSPRLGARGTETEVFLPERLDDQERFLALVDEYAVAQDVALKGSLAEFAPSQFEVNLGHGRDMTRVADEAVMLKRLVKAAARATGQRATFMAKPFEGQSGSGLHAHVSLQDRAGRNLFGETGADGEAALRHAAGGLLALMPESLLAFAPNANSYRRLRPHAYAPTAATWGVNNRTVAVRVPPGPAAARRVEHRVAGADANPYLVLAAVLAGIHHGIAERLDPGPPITGDAYLKHVPAYDGLPLSWGEAIAAFRRGDVLNSYLGDRFRGLYADCREAERERFRAKVTPTEYGWYLGI